MNHPAKFITYTATYTDLYQLTMSQVYFLNGRQSEQAVFDYFFRKLPFRGGYVVFAGLDDLLAILEDLVFSDADLQYLKGLGFDDRFLEYLKGFKFRGTIYASEEGDLVFPEQPILQIEGNLIEVQVLETILLNILNFQSLIATKASRMRQVAKDRKLIDFGLRRAQGPGGYYASRAAIIGGFNATSHLKAGMDFDIPVSGTMAHSFIQSFDDELAAFQAYTHVQKDSSVLLVDTYDTLKSGIPNAIKIGKELEAIGHRLQAIRLDSGDLAYLAKESRKMLDLAGLNYVQIAASNQLDEHVIKSLLEQQAPIDIFGIGTSLVTGQPDAALDGVYKMAECAGRPTIKLSESITKTTLPGKKQVYRMLDQHDHFLGADAVCLLEETKPTLIHHPHDPYKSMPINEFKHQPLLQQVMANGKIIIPKRSLTEIADFCAGQLSKLPPEYRRFENPHIYKVGISTQLRDVRNALIEKHNQ